MRNKVLLVIGVLLFILGQIGVNYLIYRSKNDQEIPKVKLKNQENKKDSFAIMLQQDDGTYKKSTSTSYNQPGYVFNSEKSGCIDSSGNKLENSLNYNGATNSVSLRINGVAYCYVYFDIKPKDIEVTIKTDGVRGTLPTTGGYKNILECSEGTVSFNNKYQRFEITSGNAKCTLNYEKDTGTHTSLVNKIASLVGTTQGNGELVHEEFIKPLSSKTIEQANYLNLNNDPTYPWTWSDTGKSWTSSNKGDAAKNTTSTITFNPNKDGHYQICYIQSAAYNDYGEVYKNDTKVFSLMGKTVTSYECKSLGILTVADTIKVTYRKNSSGSTGNDGMSFYIQNIPSEAIYEEYRYEGTNPNNYIWFNNEMWRIIGSIPTKVDASGTIKNLAKIIRKDSLGGIAFDVKAKGYTGVWGSNTLYKLLNEYYYGKKDGTNTAYCYGSFINTGNFSKFKCDYRVNGISSDSTDYYGRMVKNVYWNTGASTHDTTASVIYANETAKQTVQGRIGLMSASDYGYAASATYHNTSLWRYSYENITLSNWLYSKGNQWTSTQGKENGKALTTLISGDVLGDLAYGNSNYSPVIYLNENVYVINGSGAETDPYIIGM